VEKREIFMILGNFKGKVKCMNHLSLMENVSLAVCQSHKTLT